MFRSSCFLAIATSVVVLAGGCRPARRPAPSAAPVPESSCPTLGANPVAPSAACADGDAARCADDCDEGSGEACFVRARLAESHGDDVAAGRLYERACRLGSPIGCTNLGAQSFTGVGETEPACAFSLFEAACATGEPFGCGMIGRSYAEGFAVPRDPTKARKILEESCDRDGGFACYVLATHLVRGTFGEKDLDAARKRLDRGCVTGFPPACEMREKLDDASSEKL